MLALAWFVSASNSQIYADIGFAHTALATGNGDDFGFARHLVRSARRDYALGTRAASGGAGVLLLHCAAFAPTLPS